MIHTRNYFIQDEEICEQQSLTLGYFSRPLWDKKDLNHISDINHFIKILLSFMNRAGGRLYIGIDPDQNNKVIGIPQEEVDPALLEVYNSTLSISPNPMIPHPKMKVIPIPIYSDNLKEFKNGKFILKVFIEQGERTSLYGLRDDFFFRYEIKIHQNETKTEQEEQIQVAINSFTISQYTEELRMRIKGTLPFQRYKFTDTDPNSQLENEFNQIQSFNMNEPINVFESDTLEYKDYKGIGKRATLTIDQQERNEKVIVRTLCSFLNSKGGVIYLGIDDERRIVGRKQIEISEMMQDLASCFKLIQPMPVEEVNYKVEIVPINNSDHKIIRIWIFPSEENELFYPIKDARVYWRNGPSTRAMKLTEISDLLLYRKKSRSNNSNTSDLSDWAHWFNSYFYQFANSFSFNWEKRFMKQCPIELNELLAEAKIMFGIHQAKKSKDQVNLQSALSLLIEGVSNTSINHYDCLITIGAISLYLNDLESLKVNLQSACEIMLQKQPQKHSENCLDCNFSNIKENIFDSIAKSNMENQAISPEILTIVKHDIIQIYSQICSNNNSLSEFPEVKANVGYGQKVPQRTIFKELPIDKQEVKEKIKESIRNNSVVIINGGTGSGKTTRLPFILKEINKDCRIILCQPYKEAIDSLMTRIKHQLPEDDRKIYKIDRYDIPDRVPSGSGIFMMTHTALLFQMLYDSSFLSYDYVIIDEPHEKLIDTDVVISFMMLILNELAERNETKPKFILSSASMDYNYMKAVFLAQNISNKVVSITKNEENENDEERKQTEARENPDETIAIGTPQFKIDIRDNLYTFGSEKYNPLINCDPKQSTNIIIRILDEQYQDFDGHILIFAPDKSQVDKIHRFVKNHNQIMNKFHPLVVFGSGDDEAYSKSLFEEYYPKFKLIISTRVTQTAITINNLKYVIDSGWDIVRKYNRWIGAEEQNWSHISRSTSLQRRGRLGRTCDGVFIPIYSNDDFKNMIEFERCSMDKYNCGLQIVWILRYFRNTFTQKFLNQVAKSGSSEEINLLLRLFQNSKPHLELNFEISWENLLKNKILLENSEQQFLKTLDQVEKSDSMLKSKFKKYFQDISRELNQKQYKLFELKFADSEGFLRTWFTERFKEKILKLGPKDKQLVFKTILYLFEDMNPCFKCIKPNNRHPLVEECLNCHRRKFNSLEDLLSNCKDWKLTLDYNKDSFFSTLDPILNSLRSYNNLEKNRIREILDDIFITVRKEQKLEMIEGFQIKGSELEMPIVTQLCLLEDLISLIKLGVVCGASIQDFEGVPLEQRINIASRLYLSDFGVFVSEYDESMYDLKCLYNALVYGCETDAARYLAILSQDWYLFKPPAQSDLKRSDLLAQWQDKNAQFEGEPERYVLMYKDFERQIEETLKESQEVDEGNPLNNIDVKTRLQEWQEKMHIGIPKFREIYNKFQLYTQRIIPQMKESFKIEPKKSNAPFREAIFRSFSNNILYMKFLKGTTENDHKYNFVINGYQARNKIRYIVDFNSVLAENLKLLGDSAFFLFRNPMIERERNTDMSYDYPFIIKINHAAYVPPEWYSQLKIDQNLHLRAEHIEVKGPKFDESKHERDQIFIRGPTAYGLFNLPTNVIKNELKSKYPFFSVQINDNEIRRRADGDCLSINLGNNLETQSVANKEFILFGKWVKTEHSKLYQRPIQ